MALPLMSLKTMGETRFVWSMVACSLVPPGIVFEERVGQSGIAAATLDCVLGYIDGFPFGLVHTGSKLHLVRSARHCDSASTSVAAFGTSLRLVLLYVFTKTLKVLPSR